MYASWLLSLKMSLFINQKRSKSTQLSLALSLSSYEPVLHGSFPFKVSSLTSNTNSTLPDQQTNLTYPWRRFMLAFIDDRIGSYSRKSRLAFLGVTHLVMQLFVTVPDAELPAAYIPLEFFYQTFPRGLVHQTEDAMRADLPIARYHWKSSVMDASTFNNRWNDDSRATSTRSVPNRAEKHALCASLLLKSRTSERLTRSVLFRST